MQDKLARAIAIFLIVLFSPGVGAACKEPAMPNLPDPMTALRSEMVKAQEAVKAYLARQERFLNCVRNEKRHNTAVERMHKLAERFNQLVRAYKARQSNEADDTFLALVQPVSGPR